MIYIIKNARPVRNVLAGFYNHFRLIAGAYVCSEHLQSRQAALEIKLKQSVAMSGTVNCQIIIPKARFQEMELGCLCEDFPEDYEFLI